MTLLLAASACSPDYAHTWGDTAEDLSRAYCERIAACDLFGTGDFDVEQCVEHSVYHLCALEETCDVEVPGVGVTECVLDMATQDCVLMLYGFLPESCEAPFNEQPEGDIK